MQTEDVKYLVVHCSATQAKSNLGVKEIRKMHLERGMKDVGYHYVIKRDGVVETGRSLNKASAHVMGYNAQSIGICLIGGIDSKGNGEDNFTLDQYVALAELIIQLKDKFPKALVQGHRDFPNVAKECPCFDVKAWYKETVENHVGTNPIKRANTPAILK
jgi:N-acetyl-anhydromuramyl-L-alanine amidase AmpD